MADETRIDPEASRRIFKAVESVGGDIGDALARVKNVRATLPEPWGSDEYGDRFAKGKEPNAVTTLGYVDKAITFCRDLGSEGRGAIDEFEQQDEDNSYGLS